MKPDRAHPITIVGGGLAGLALGIALRREGIPVSVYEKRRYPFHRVCGEFLSGVSLGTLERLGVAEQFEGAVTIETMRWYGGNRCVLEDALPRPARGLSRYTLDARLARTFTDRGGILRTGESFQAKYPEGLVWATGKVRGGGGHWIGLSAHFDDVAVDGLEMHCGERGYLGLSPVEGGRVNVTGLFKVDRTLGGRGLELLLSYLGANGATALVERLRCGAYVEDSFVAVAGFDFGRQARPGEFAVGDRSHLIPPFSGNGMSMALEAAEHACATIADYVAGRYGWTQAIAAQQRFARKAFGVRMQVAARLQSMLLSQRGLGILGRIAGSGWLPAKTLYHLLR